jgi:hypothetical protein
VILPSPIQAGRNYAGKKMRRPFATKERRTKTQLENLPFSDGLDQP